MCTFIHTSGSEQCKPKKKRQKLPAKLPQISAKLTQIPAKTRKSENDVFWIFYNAMKTQSSLPCMCEMVLIALGILEIDMSYGPSCGSKQLIAVLPTSPDSK